MAIETLLIVGGVFGLVAGATFRNPRLGCLALLIVPLAMIAYVYGWQNAHSANIRSTSGLDFVFGPFWPSLGAMGGYLAGAVLKYAVLEKRDDS